jgi:phosphatidate cytidylyltransferase
MAIPGLPVEVVVLATTLGLATVALASGGVGREALQEVGVSVFAPLYIGLPLGALAAIRWTLGREPTLLVIATIAASDTAQYYSGRLFGRRPLAAAISPKKTIEGAVGGFVGGVAAMAGLGAWWLPEFSLPFRVGLGVALVAVGIAGDLFESLIKRSVGVKDASALIPGHGGILDRIDALLFAAPVFYVFVRYGY